MKVAFIGGGTMAEAIVRGMLDSGMRDVIVSEPRHERRSYLEKTLGIVTTGDNSEAVKAANIVILAVKPQQMAEVLGEIADGITEDHTVVSIAAGITLDYLGKTIKTTKLIRAMPNMALHVGEGMTVLSLCDCFTGEAMNMVREIFMASGRVMVMPERHMNAVTALSGSGPAFLALFVKAMADFGAQAGLTEEDAVHLAVQTAVGTARLLDGEFSPDQLISAVKSPGGTTAEGLRVFDDAGLAGIVAQALEAALRRADELSQ